jgi:predicted TIM-barrel fold metal-dependent hydrolase
LFELAAKCQNTLFRPCGTVKLALPAWQDDVKRCAEEYGTRVIRLHPNDHDYTLETPAFRELLALAGKHRLLVQLVAPVDLRPLAPILREMQVARVILPFQEVTTG